jgi:hypothetical protein
MPLCRCASEFPNDLGSRFAAFEAESLHSDRECERTLRVRHAAGLELTHKVIVDGLSLRLDPPEMSSSERPIHRITAHAMPRSRIASARYFVLKVTPR